MRIISDFQDYYDCIQREGQDETCVWIRHREECEIRGYPFPTFVTPYFSHSHRVSADFYAVGFCGKVYPVVRLNSFNSSKGKSTSALCHSFEDVDKFITENFKKRQIEHYFKPKKNAHYGVGVRRTDVLNFYERVEEKRTAFWNIFVENACPVFVAQLGDKSFSKLVFHGRRDKDKEPVLNFELKPPECKRVKGRYVKSLKDLEFYKYFPPQEAFQEIHMYLGGVLGFNNPHVPVPDDKTMREIKGFDDRSFKKEPSKKKNKGD